MPRKKSVASFLLLAALAALCPASAHAAEKPKVRAITAFIHLDRARYQQQVEEALLVLRRAQAAFEAAGYEVQTLRIATQPFPDYTRDLLQSDALAFFQAYDQLMKKENIDAAIGPAMLSDADDPRAAELLAAVLRSTSLSGSLAIAGEDGVHWRAVREAAKLILYWSENSPGGQANFNFAASALVPPNTPFYPAAYHLGAGRQFALALQSANVVAEAFKPGSTPEEARSALAAALGEHARALEAVAQTIAQEMSWEYMGLDLSPAPLKEVSIGGAIEKLTGAPFGSSGTMTAAAAITQALRSIPVKQAGYSGLMVPVLEDSVLAQRWSEGTLTLDALLAYSAVCGTGLDTIPLPGDVSRERLERILGDVASLAVELHKPLSARLMPVAGKKPGDRTEFDDPFLVNATLQPLR